MAKDINKRIAAEISWARTYMRQLAKRAVAARQAAKAR
jgi:hypothetical protein